MVRANLLYTLNGGEKSEEWYRTPATVAGNVATATLPEGTTHYVINLIDENNFLRSHPEFQRPKTGKAFSKLGIAR